MQDSHCGHRDDLRLQERICLLVNLQCLLVYFVQSAVDTPYSPICLCCHSRIGLQNFPLVASESVLSPGVRSNQIHLESLDSVRYRAQGNIFQHRQERSQCRTRAPWYLRPVKGSWTSLSMLGGLDGSASSGKPKPGEKEKNTSIQRPDSQINVLRISKCNAKLTCMGRIRRKNLAPCRKVPRCSSRRVAR